MDQQDPKDAAEKPPLHVQIWTNCAQQLETLKPEDRGRVLRSLVELYRPDFEKKQPDTRLAQVVSGQLATGGQFDYQPIKYGGQ